MEEQEQRKQKTGKKQSLSTIILEFCTKGLSVSSHFAQNRTGSVQKKDDSVQNFQGFEQNNTENNPLISKSDLDEIARLKENLLRQQQELQSKEHRLESRETEIKEKESELTEKTQKVLQEWNEFLVSKEQSQQKSFDKIGQRWQFEKQIQELDDKKETIKRLKQENIQLKEDFIKTLRKIDQQTEKNVIFDYIVPFLPSVISIIGFFITNRKIDNIQELDPVQAEIGNIMKKLSNTDKKKLSMKLEESLKAFSSK
jgi:hypothetical protein